MGPLLVSGWVPDPRCGVMHRGCSQISGRYLWFWKTSAPPLLQVTPGDLVAPLRTHPHPMGLPYLTGGSRSRPRGQEEPWMRGLAPRAPSHSLHIPDCILHAVHGIHSLPVKEQMLMFIEAPRLSVSADPPGWREGDPRPCGP